MSTERRKPYPFDQIEARWQAHWDRAADLSRAESGRTGLRCRKRPKFYVLDMFPYPSGAGLHVGIRRATPPPTSSAATSGCAASTSCTRWAGTPSACPPSSTRSRPAQHPRDHHRAEHRHLPPADQALGFCYDWDREVEPPTRLLQVDAVDLPAALRHLVRPEQTQGPADQRTADPTTCDRATRSAIGRAPPGLSGRSAGELVPGAGHGAGQRGGRSTARARSAASRSCAGRCGSGCCGSPPTPIACSTIWRRSTGRSRSRRCSATGSAGAKARRSISSVVEASERIAKHRSASSPPGPTRCSARPTWCSRRSIRWSIAITTDGAEGRRSRRIARRPRARATSTAPSWRRTKTGVFTGAYAINPVNGEQIPIWIADYVLLGYGTGAIMAVPATTSATSSSPSKFDLPIRAVVTPNADDRLTADPCSTPSR